MAGRGPAPKDPADRRRRNATPAAVPLAADDELRGPDLPEEVKWPTQTVKWWRTWRESPQAQTFTDTDWSFLLDTAVMHSEFWQGNLALAAELRLRVAKFGATPEDRARLRMSVGEPKKAPDRTWMKETSVSGRRDRLLKAVGDGG